MFRCCWKSSTVAPIVSMDHARIRPSTTTQITVRSSSKDPSKKYAWGTSKTNTQAITNSSLSTTQSSSSRPTLSSRKIIRFHSHFDRLILRINLLIGSYLSFQECSKIKAVNFLFSCIFNKKEYLDLFIHSFHGINRYAEEMYYFNEKKSSNWSKISTIMPSFENFKVSSLLKHLTEKCKSDPKKTCESDSYTQKLYCLSWYLQRHIESYYHNNRGDQNTRIEAEKFIETAGAVPRPDLVPFYSKKLNDLSPFFSNNFFENFTWDYLSLLIVLNYFDRTTIHKRTDWMNILADSITQQCIKENNTDNWKKFISDLLQIEKFCVYIAIPIYERIFHNLEKLKKVSEDDFEISNKRLMNLFRTRTKHIELFCNHRPYTDEDLSFIRNRCRKILTISLHYPSFSSDAIERFCKHPRSASITHFHIQHNVVYLSNIRPLLQLKSAYLQISTLKMQAIDLPILQSWNTQNANRTAIKACIQCDHILIEDVVNEKNVNKWNDCLMDLGLSQKVKRVNFQSIPSEE